MSHQVLRTFPRWFVGFILIATGTGKTLDIPGFVHVLAAYDLLPSWGNATLAYTLPLPRFIKIGKRLVAYRVGDLRDWLRGQARNNTIDAA